MVKTRKFLAAVLGSWFLFGLPARAQLLPPDPQTQRDLASQQIEQQSLATQQNNLQLQQQMQADQARRSQLFSAQPPLFNNSYANQPFGAQLPPPRH